MDVPSFASSWSKFDRLGIPCCWRQATGRRAVDIAKASSCVDVLSVARHHWWMPCVHVVLQDTALPDFDSFSSDALFGELVPVEVCMGQLPCRWGLLFSRDGIWLALVAVVVVVVC